LENKYLFFLPQKLFIYVEAHNLNFTINVQQVRTILDLHYLNICSGIYRHICDILSSQIEAWGMELWHKSGDLVCWLVLWLCHLCSSLFVSNPQILLCTIRSCPTTLSLWIFPVCLYSSTGKWLLFKFYISQENMKFEIFLCILQSLCLVQCLSVVPWEIFRWMIAGVAGLMSATFVALNLRAHILSAGERWLFIVGGIFLLQLALSVALKVYLFKITVWKGSSVIIYQHQWSVNNEESFCCF